MTNEEFIQELRDVEYLMPEAVLPYARKLVALSEAANAVAENTAPKTCCKCGAGEDYVLDGITLHALSNIIKKLEGGEE